MINIDHTSDPELLRAVAHLLDDEVQRLQKVIKEQSEVLAKLSTKDAEEVQRRLEHLEKELRDRRDRALCGGSERRPRDKTDEDKKAKEKQKKPPSKKGGARTPQPLLPIEHVDQSLEPADQTCPCCGNGLVEWQGKADVSEVIDVTEVRYTLKKQTQRKYTCQCGHIETAAGIRKLAPGSRYSMEFGIHVVLSRFVDLLPLERLRKIMARSGLAVTSQTLWNQLRMVANLLEPAKDRLLAQIREGGVALADETRWPLLGARSGKGLENKHDTKNWCIWAIVGRSGIVYEIQDSRSNEAGRKLLDGFRGILVTDGYVVYRSLAKEGNFVLAHDWVHVRRKFLEAEISNAKESKPFLDDIGELFLIEREIDARVAGLPPIEAKALRKQVRDERSKPIVARIGRRAVEVRALKESPLGEALRYLENQWDGLQVFLRYPEVPITTNGVEQTLRNPVVGRKTSLGSRSEDGIRVTAILHSLVETAKHCGVDPAEYLRVALIAALDGAPIPLPADLK